MSPTMQLEPRTDDLDVFDNAHENVVFCHDDSTGLRAIIAIHSTKLGPALGGTRFYPYPTERDALTDVLRLSRGMTYKAAVAGVALGGGKAVIIGDPGSTKTPELLRAYGKFVQDLAGKYVTAGDIGTSSDDLDVIAGSTAHVVGRGRTSGGSGDSGPSTALGVFQSMRSAARSVWGSDSLAGRTVGVEGAGKVGRQLIGLLRAADASVVVSDSYAPALDRVVAQFPGVTIASNVSTEKIDVYAPCAMGATLHRDSVAALTASIVCGAANNQLLTADVEIMLADRGIVWIPDYVANAGGLIQVEGELRGRSDDEVRTNVLAIENTVSAIIEMAGSEGILFGQAADRLAENRIASAR